MKRAKASPRGRQRRQAAFALALLFGGLALGMMSGCRDNEVKVGFIGGVPRSGSDFASAGRNGARLALDRASQEAPGSLRFRLLVDEESQSKEDAIASLRKMHEEGARVVIGPMTSALAGPLAEEAQRLGILLVAPAAGAESIVGKDDMLLRGSSASEEYGAQAAEEHFKRLGVKKAALLMDEKNREHAESYARGYKMKMEALGGTVAYARYGEQKDEAVDYALAAKTAMESAPDIAVALNGAPDAALLIRALRSVGHKGLIAGSGLVDPERLNQLAGAESDGVYLELFMDSESKEPSWIDFKREYETKFKSQPPFGALCAWDVARGIAQGFQKLGAGASAMGLKEELLREGKWPGAQGAVPMDKFGDAKRPSFFGEMRDGKLAIFR